MRMVEAAIADKTESHVGYSGGTAGERGLFDDESVEPTAVLTVDELVGSTDIESIDPIVDEFVDGKSQKDGVKTRYCPFGWIRNTVLEL